MEKPRSTTRLRWVGKNTHKDHGVQTITVSFVTPWPYSLASHTDSSWGSAWELLAVPGGGWACLGRVLGVAASGLEKQCMVSDDLKTWGRVNTRFGASCCSPRDGP